jgi:hypothetical protein
MAQVLYLFMAFPVPVKTMEGDEKAKAKRPAGSEDRETLHEYVGGHLSNPITSDTPDEAERRGGSGTRSAGTVKKDEPSTRSPSKTQSDR